MSYEGMIDYYSRNAATFAENMIKQGMRGRKRDADFMKENELTGRQQGADIPKHPHRFDLKGFRKSHVKEYGGHGATPTKRKGFPQGSQKRGLGKGPLGQGRGPLSQGMGMSGMSTGGGSGNRRSGGSMMMPEKPMRGKKGGLHKAGGRKNKYGHFPAKSGTKMGMGKKPLRMPAGSMMDTDSDQPMSMGKKPMYGGSYLKKQKISRGMKKHHMGY